MGSPSGITCAARRAQIKKQEKRAALKQAAQEACRTHQQRACKQDGYNRNPNYSKVCNQPAAQATQTGAVAFQSDEASHTVKQMDDQDYSKYCIADRVQNGETSAFSIDGKPAILNHACDQSWVYEADQNCWREATDSETKAMEKFQSEFKSKYESEAFKEKFSNIDLEEASETMYKGLDRNQNDQCAKRRFQDSVQEQYNDKNFYKDKDGNLYYVGRDGAMSKFNPEAKDGVWDSYDLDQALKPTPMPLVPPGPPAPESSPTKMTTGNNKVNSSTKNNAEPIDQDEWMDDAMKEAFKINDQQIKEQAKLKQQKATKAQEQAELQKNLRAQAEEHADSTWTEINREHQLDKGKELLSGLGAKVSAIGSAISEGLNDIVSDTTADLLNSLPATTDSVNGKSEAELKLIQDLENGIEAISKHLPGGQTVMSPGFRATF